MWWTAIRPKTLPAAVVPVVVGGALAAHNGPVDWRVFICTLFTALLIQIATNFANDVVDFEKGADTHDRVGPQRVTQAGLVTPSRMKLATGIVLSLALLNGFYLAFIGGWPIVVIGLLSLAFAIGYTAGPYPIAYLGLGELFVLIFFGPVAVGGTFYLLTMTLTPAVATTGLAVGCLSAAILVVNNLRDLSGDALVGKRTLAVRFGERFSRLEYSFFLTLAATLPCAEALSGLGPRHGWFAAGFLLAAKPAATLVATAHGAALNPALGYTARLLVIFGLLYLAGVIVSP
ncbi:MAG: 1,4-dihydroxy-2-naphthoate polyprenyltransferase [Bdellovibrionales bacterium]|nr:1,4-dihydroxy-2-naphthoate polyprenyltransferase [Bdellovibrionales bacterium]